MKKLMITAAAALCATLGYSEITSQNVVGYSSAQTKAGGCTGIGVCFQAVTGKMDLQDIKVTGYEAPFEGDVYMQTLDPYGRTVDTYTWVDVPLDEEDPESVAFYGWYDGDDLIEGVTVNPGDGFWVYSDDPKYGIQSAGQVIATGASVTLGSEGCKMIANPLAVDVDLQDIAIGGYEGAFEGDVYAQTLDEYGRTVDTYTWVDIPLDEEDPESVAFYGWYDGDELIEGVTIKAGTGLWTSSDSSTYTMEFPGLNL